MLITDERTLTAVSCIEPTPVDGVLGVVDMGQTFMITYYRLRPVRFDRGQMVYERDPVLNLLRPRSTVLPGSLVARWLMSMPMQ